jgi:hypothetical protein
MVCDKQQDDGAPIRFLQTARSMFRRVEELQLKAKHEPPQHFQKPARETILEEQQ